MEVTTETQAACQYAPIERVVHFKDQENLHSGGILKRLEIGENTIAYAVKLQ